MERVTGFKTSVCEKCGNVARNVSINKENLFDDAKNPCRVCGQSAWRECVLDERIPINELMEE